MSLLLHDGSRRDLVAFFMMTPLTPLVLLMGAAGAVAIVVLLAWLCSRWWYGRQIGGMKARSRKLEQVHSSLLEKHSNLVAQLDVTRSELRTQKALTASLNAKTNERGAAVEPVPQPAALTEPFITSRSPRRPLDFEDTQIL